jgi:hypothetical protein
VGRDELRFSLNAPLDKNDTEKQTFGCRHTNPDICKNNGLPCCAFNSNDKICRQPSRKWKDVYNFLKGKL